MRLRRLNKLVRCVGLFLIVALVGTQAPPVFAQLPQEGRLVSGVATWEADLEEGWMVVDQGSQRAVIDWDSFSIGAENSVTFNQPNDSAVALNRVIGDDPSEILGTLKSNGSVFLVNPHGVIFGRDATIDVGSLIASSLWMKVDDPRNQPFWKDDSTLDIVWGDGEGLLFEMRDGDPYGDVVNQATISTHGDGSYIFLLGPALVRNEGGLYAHGSGARVGMAAGGSVHFQDVKVPLDEEDVAVFPRRFVVDQATAHALVEIASDANLESDTILLSAAATKELQQSVINQQGIVMAKDLVIDGGEKGTVRLGGEYSNSSNWDMEIEVKGARIHFERDDDKAVEIMSREDQSFVALEEIRFDSDLLYRNWIHSLPQWDFIAPKVSIDADLAPADANTSRKPWVSIGHEDLPLSLTSSADTKWEVQGLDINGKTGEIDLRGKLDVAGGAFIGGFEELSSLKLTHPENSFGNGLHIYSDGWYQEPLRIGEGRILAAGDGLELSGNVYAENELFVWIDGGHLTISDDDTRIGAGGLVTLAATGGGVFINEVGQELFVGPGRVRIYSSSDMNGYNSGGLDAWEHEDLVEFLEDPAAPKNVIYFLDASGSVVLVIEVLEQSVPYGTLTPASEFSYRTYLKHDPDQLIELGLTTPPHFLLRDEDGEEHGPAWWATLPVGGYTILPRGATSDRFRIEYAPGPLTIEPRQVTITIENAARYYGSDNTILDELSVSFVNLAPWHQNNVRRDDYRLESAPPDASVGEYPIALTFLREELRHNYSISYAPGSARLSVTQRPLEVEVRGASRWFGDENDFSRIEFLPGEGGAGLALGQSLEDLGFGGDPARILTTEATPGSWPGAYRLDLDPSALTDLAGNYSITLIGDYIVERRPITVRAHDRTLYYLDNVLDNKYEYSVSNLVDGFPLDEMWLPQRLPDRKGHGIPPVGEYTIMWAVSDDLPHPLYQLTFETGTLTIIPRPITIEVHDIERHYGQEVPRGHQYTSTIEGLPEETVWRPHVIYRREGKAAIDSPVGVYEDEIDAWIKDTTNFDVTVKKGKVTITPKPITLVAGGEKVYGEVGNGPTLSAGIAPWDDLESIFTNVTFSNNYADPTLGAGHYRVEITGYTLNSDNYVVTEVHPGWFTVTPRDLYVAVGDIKYHKYERKPYPIISFQNQAPHDSVDVFLRDGCLELAGGHSCGKVLFGTDDPYYRFEMRQPNRIRPDGYSGPWEWVFIRNSPSWQNYNIVYSQLGHEIVLPPLSEEEILDLIFVNPSRTFPRQRDWALAPEPFGPEDVAHRGVQIEKVKTSDVLSTEYGFTAGLPNESQEIVGRALVNFLGSRNEMMTASRIEELYRQLQEGDPWVMQRVFPFLVAELHGILEKEEWELTAGERAYVNHIASMIQEEKRRTAMQAQIALDLWRQGDNKRRADAPMLNHLFDYGSPVPDYVREAALLAEIGFGIPGGTAGTRFTEMILGLSGLAASIGGAIGGGIIGAGGALHTLTTFVFPFAQRGGEAILAGSGATLGASVAGAVIAVTTIASMVIVDLVDRDKIVKKIETAARDAQGPPPTFSDLKKMMETEEGQLTLLMHQMNAFAQFLPGGRDASRDIYNRLY